MRKGSRTDARPCDRVARGGDATPVRARRVWNKGLVHATDLAGNYQKTPGVKWVTVRSRRRELAARGFADASGPANPRAVTAANAQRAWCATGRAEARCPGRLYSPFARPGRRAE